MTAYRRQLARDAYAQAGNRPRAAAVAELATLFERDAVLRMSLTRSIGEAETAGYALGYNNIDDLMTILDYVMRYAPPFSETSLIVCPINALLDWPMCMPSGYPLFRDEAVNTQLGRVLSTWCDFLSARIRASISTKTARTAGSVRKHASEWSSMPFAAARRSRIGASTHGTTSSRGGCARTRVRSPSRAIRAW